MKRLPLHRLHSLPLEDEKLILVEIAENKSSKILNYPKLTIIQISGLSELSNLEMDLFSSGICGGTAIMRVTEVIPQSRLHYKQ